MRTIRVSHKGKVYSFTVEDNLDRDAVEDLIERHEYSMFRHQTEDPNYKKNGSKDKDDAILFGLQNLRNQYPVN